MNPYANARIYGPYIRKDKRMHVICIFPDGTRRTVSYPKYLVEKSIGRILNNDEEVHHKNDDRTDNKLENFEIVNTTTHRKLHAIRILSQDFICPVCGIEFSLQSKELSNIIRNREMGRSKTGPYCSKECAGFGSDIRTEINPEYYTLLSLYGENHKVDAANSVESVISDNAEQD